MKKTNFLYGPLVLVAIAVLFSSCTKKVIKEIDITYQVTATITERDFTVYYANDINGEDVVNDTATLLWEYTYTVKADTAEQRKYELYVYCGEAYPDPISQTITTRIIEDGNVVAEKTTGGTASILYSDTYISALLPSQTILVDAE